MQEWLIYGFLALFTWGLWGFFPKLATNYLKPNEVLVWEVIGAIAIGTIVLYQLNFKPDFNIKGFIFSFLTGVCGTLGMLFFLIAIRSGKVTILVTMTALYPIITLSLAFFVLKEPITLKQGIGIILAIFAMWLLA